MLVGSQATPGQFGMERNQFLGSVGTHRVGAETAVQFVLVVFGKPFIKSYPAEIRSRE
jgi:hypothetical protein